MTSTTTSNKRERDDDNASLQQETSPAHAQQDGSSTTNFRNVSACNRCRTRKNRCDQKLPQCTGCEKAGVSCLGFDPLTKRSIPRSYVYYLESRVRKLELLLRDHGISCPPPEDDFAINEDIRPGQNVPYPVLEADPQMGGGAPPIQYESVQHPGVQHRDPTHHSIDPALEQHTRPAVDPTLRNVDEAKTKLDKLVSDVGMVSVQGTSESRYLGSFARVVFAAVKSSTLQTPSEKGSRRPSRAATSDANAAGGSSMRDSFFGLYTKPTIKAAPFPDRPTGMKLVELYFEHANPQIPILHRGEFEALVQRVYSTDPDKRMARELYLLNIVFAIGSGIIMDSWHADIKPEPAADDEHQNKRQKTNTQQYQPEEYHSSAVVHLESFLSSTPAALGGGAGLEEPLQAVLLLASLALLRPVAPGLWYIVGVAVRLAVDLGLHSEEVDPQLDAHVIDRNSGASRSTGRKQWNRDLRRRLWWCVYTVDRLVSTCVGRPFGIPDQIVTTEFPSMLDDKYITTKGFLEPLVGTELPSYKLIARHYFRLRLLQSEILQVLQHRQAEKLRILGANQDNEYMHKDLTSPFLQRFGSFRDWRFDIDRRLFSWKESAPKQIDTGVAFSPLFLELNYWQAIVMLYRQSLTVPEQLAGEMAATTSTDVQSPGSIEMEAKEDEQMVFMKVAQAGQMVLKLYRQLHRLKLVSYTFLATHHLFMSGISFLYAIWHSPLVRSQLSIDDVDFSVLSATSVLADLAEKCPPAEACRGAFVRMSKATVAMVEKTTGFGTQSTLSQQPLQSPNEYFGGPDIMQYQTTGGPQPDRPRKHNATMPRFDMNLRELFEDNEIATRPVQNQLKPRVYAGQSPPTDYRRPPQSAGPYANPLANAAPPYNTPLQNVQLGISNRQPYVPFAQAIAETQSDFSYDDLSFLDNFPVSDPSSNTWAGWNRNGFTDLDLGFATGGNGGYEPNEEWDLNGIEMFGGFFFGNDSGGAM